MKIRQILYRSKFFEEIKIQKMRDNWVINQLSNLVKVALYWTPVGSQRYRKFCADLQYYGQDIAEYKNDKQGTLENSIGTDNGYKFGKPDFLSVLLKVYLLMMAPLTRCCVQKFLNIH